MLFLDRQLINDISVTVECAIGCLNLRTAFVVQTSGMEGSEGHGFLSRFDILVSLSRKYFFLPRRLDLELRSEQGPA